MNSKLNNPTSFHKQTNGDDEIKEIVADPLITQEESLNA